MTPITREYWTPYPEAVKEVAQWQKEMTRKWVDLQKKNPNSKYLQQSYYGCSRTQYKSLLSSHDWTNYKADIKHKQSEIVKFQQHELLNTNAQNMRINTRFTNGVNFNNVNVGAPELYIKNSNLTHNVELCEIVHDFFKCITFPLYDSPCMLVQVPLDEIETNDENNSLDNDSKLYFQLMCDLTQQYLSFDNLTIETLCKFESSLCHSWDILAANDKQIALAIVTGTMERVDWWLCESHNLEYVSNLLHSARYNGDVHSHDTSRNWLLYAFYYLDGLGILNDKHCIGLWNIALSDKDNHGDNIVQDMTRIPKSLLASLLRMRYIASHILALWQTCDDNANQASDILFMCAQLYKAGSQINFAHFIDILTNFQLFAPLLNMNCDNEISDLKNMLCMTAAAWRNLGYLAGFNGTQLSKNQKLSELWCVYVISAIFTISMKCYEIESEYYSILQLVDNLKQCDLGMCYVFYRLSAV